MQTKLRLGTVFGTNLYVDISWFFVLIFASLTLIYKRIEPIPEAIITALLLFGSVLMVTLLQIRKAHDQGLEWERVTLVPFGNIVERTYKSAIAQEVKVAGIGLLAYSVLGMTFGGLWFLMPNSIALGTELQLVGLFNLIMALFHLLFRLTPHADNLLHAGLTSVWQTGYPNRFMTLIRDVTIWFYVASGIVILLAQLDRFVLGWWFFSLLILSRIVTLGEEHGEYRDDIPSSVWSMMPDQPSASAPSKTRTQF